MTGLDSILKACHSIEGFTHKSGYGGGTFGLLTTNSDYPSYVDNGSDSGRKDTWNDLKIKSKLVADSLIPSLKERMSRSDDW